MTKKFICIKFRGLGFNCQTLGFSHWTSCITHCHKICKSKPLSKSFSRCQKDDFVASFWEWVAQSQVLIPDSKENLNLLPKLLKMT